MDTHRKSLQDAFIEDHRKMTMGFYRLRQSLEDADWPEARRLAEKIDRDVGSHIEFEETLYYPRLKPVIGAENISRMYEEHQIGLGLIRDIDALGPDEPENEVCSRLADRCREMLEHAQSCGTLISHLTDLPQEEQAELLAELQEIRGRGTRWTEFAGIRNSSGLNTNTG
jgi:hypothetical protein